jgi:hypothetical protein
LALTALTLDLCRYCHFDKWSHKTMFRTMLPHVARGITNTREHFSLRWYKQRSGSGTENVVEGVCDLQDVIRHSKAKSSTVKTAI